MSSIFLQEIKLVPSNLIEGGGGFKITVWDKLRIELQTLQGRYQRLTENDEDFWMYLDDEERIEYENKLFTESTLSSKTCINGMCDPIVYPADLDTFQMEIFAKNIGLERANYLYQIIDILSINKPSKSYYRDFLIGQLDLFVSSLNKQTFKKIDNKDDLKELLENAFDGSNVMMFKNIHSKNPSFDYESNMEIVEIKHLTELLRFWDYLGIFKFLNDSWSLNDREHGVVDFFFNKSKAANVVFSMIPMGAFTSLDTKKTLKRQLNDILTKRARNPDFLSDYEKLDKPKSDDRYQTFLKDKKIFTELGLKPKKKD